MCTSKLKLVRTKTTAEEIALCCELFSLVPVQYTVVPSCMNTVLVYKVVLNDLGEVPCL